MIFVEMFKICMDQKRDYISALRYKQKELECRVKDKAMKTEMTALGISLTNRVIWLKYIKS
jgi:hypothetical protein